jgi:hypothetical protein
VGKVFSLPSFLFAQYALRGVCGTRGRFARESINFGVKALCHGVIKSNLSLFYRELLALFSELNSSVKGVFQALCCGR